VQVDVNGAVVLLKVLLRVHSIAKSAADAGARDKSYRYQCVSDRHETTVV
jgi:hypothetical protein